MTLTVRKIIVLGFIGIVFLMANILVVANWISDTGIADKADWIRREFLTGTAIAVILALLILLVIDRKLHGMNGYMAVQLWWDYVNNGNQDSLRMLLAYISIIWSSDQMSNFI